MLDISFGWFFIVNNVALDQEGYLTYFTRRRTCLINLRVGCKPALLSHDTTCYRRDDGGWFEDTSTIRISYIYITTDNYYLRNKKYFFEVIISVRWDQIQKGPKGLMHSNTPITSFT